jgi:hypothetical protein
MRASQKIARQVILTLRSNQAYSARGLHRQDRQRHRLRQEIACPAPAGSPIQRVASTCGTPPWANSATSPSAGAAAAAEHHFRQALDWARRQGASSWELRAATSLARLLRDRDRIGEARDLLAPIYERFTEGFGTADLQAGKKLLDELHSPHRQ